MNRKQMLSSVRAYVSSNDLELQNATLLLGGPNGLRRFQRMRGALQVADTLQPKQKHELRWLLDLLSLENVHDLNREEAGYFAEINPDDPPIWSICILTDGLRELISQFSTDGLTSDLNDMAA